MNIIRIKFARGEKVKFISHLDLMKVFERALRRTGLPVAYSQGFNPHPQMVFGLPLSVGVTSEAEYADFELSLEMDPFIFMNRLNEGLPEGIRVLDARVRQSKGNIMASISGAEYEITVFLKKTVELLEMSKSIANFMGRINIIIKKEGKAGVKDVDIRPLILRLEAVPETIIPQGYEGFGSAFRISALLRAGSSANLRPELLMAAISEDSGYDMGTCRIHRCRLYVDRNGKFADPMDEVV